MESCFDLWNEIVPYFRKVFLHYNFKYLFGPIVFTFFRNPSYAFVVSPSRLFSIFLNSFILSFYLVLSPFLILIPVPLIVLHACSPWVSCSLVFISEMVLSFSSSSFLRSISSHLLSSSFSRTSPVLMFLLSGLPSSRNYFFLRVFYFTCFQFVLPFWIRIFVCFVAIFL